MALRRIHHTAFLMVGILLTTVTVIAWRGETTQILRGQVILPTGPRIAAGWSHSLYLDPNGGVYAWGSNEFGQLGDNSATRGSLVPVRVKGLNGVGNLSGIRAVAAGRSFSLALGNDGKVYKWGAGSNVPVTVVGPDGTEELSDITAIAAGATHAVAIGSGGVIYAWGSNNKGQLGNGSATDSSIPVRVKHPSGTGELSGIQVAAGENWTLALGSDGFVYAWGLNNFGELGNGTYGNSTLPVRVKNPSGTGDFSGIQAVDAGGQMDYGPFSLALTNDGLVYTWGYNGLCQLGNNSAINSSIPVGVTGVGSMGPLSNITAISGGGFWSLALGNDGSVFFWGNIGGINYRSCVASKQKGPDRMSDLSGIQAIAAGEGSALALGNDGSIYQWGSIWGCSSSYDYPILVQFGGDGTGACASSSSSISSSPTSSFSSTSSVNPCGNGAIEGTERCDDRNTVNNDGCSSLCSIEPGYACTGAPSICTLICGNGLVDPGEQCDDRNLTNHDGCSSLCITEPGYVCSGLPSICQTLCGDAIKAGLEQCDDGNLINNDGCSSLCAPDIVLSSSSSFSSIASIQFSSSSLASAQPLCGNGRLEGNETCEQGIQACPAGFSCDRFLCRCAAVPAVASSSRSSVRSSSISSVSVPVCGNRILDAGEECETGFPCTAGSFCSAACKCMTRSSSVSNSIASSSSSSVASLISMVVSSSFSSTATCGNGVLEPGEQCDFGIGCPNGDPCMPMCTCPLPSSSFSSVAPLCGNGLPDPNESCDDGNTNTGDGCSSTCQPEQGFSCSGTPSFCDLCGNGMIAGNEQCDDANLLPFDGCSPDCQFEIGYSCYGQPSSCLPVCGDGTRIPPEQCDDGNMIDGDGCSSVCENEFAVAPSSVASDSSASFIPLLVCGNGLTEEGEECDDGNLFDNDGCSHICIRETFSSAFSESSLSFSESSSSSAPVLMPSEPVAASVGSNVWLWAVIAIFVIMIVIMSVLWMRNRNKSSQE